jgi:hypothetical protein
VLVAGSPIPTPTPEEHSVTFVVSTIGKNLKELNRTPMIFYPKFPYKLNGIINSKVVKKSKSYAKMNKNYWIKFVTLSKSLRPWIYKQEK